MQNEPSDKIFIKFGKFEASATGRIAVIALAVTVCLATAAFRDVIPWPDWLQTGKTASIEKPP